MAPHLRSAMAIPDRRIQKLRKLLDIKNRKFKNAEKSKEHTYVFVKINNFIGIVGRLFLLGLALYERMCVVCVYICVSVCIRDRQGEIKISR